MVLTLYDLDGKKVAPLYGATAPHIKRVLDGGDETLDFEYPREAEHAGQIVNEAAIRTDRQEYIIKDIDKSTGDKKIKISCSLNIDALEGAAMPGGFETVERTLAECVEKALNGTGWRAIVDPALTKRRTVRIENDTTAWGVIKQALSTYRCELRIESIAQALHFTEKRGQDRGSYFYERLGLRSLGVKASSYGFYTRLIPICKDGLRLWEDGKDYIENHQYSRKVITATWRDERYTNTTSLREDAVARLEEASAPVVAYSAEIVKLVEQRPEFSVSDYDLGDAVTLCSISLRTKTRQRIVQIDEYPDDPAKNTVELSNVRQSFAQLQKTADEAAKQEAIDISGRKTDSTLRENYYTKTEVSTSIQAMEEAIRLEVSQTYVTVDTLAGYSTTEQVTSAIELAVENITLEVSKNYSTKTETQQVKADAATDATNKANAAQKAANDATDKKLESYSTTVEMNSAINLSAENITLEVRKNYSTKTETQQVKTDAATDATNKANAAQSAAEKTAATDATNKANAAEKNANDATDKKLESYSTTVEMNSAINQSAEGITLEVSKTYATQASLGSYTKTSEVRSKFAMDSSSVTIESGVVTFNSNTFVVNSTNFTLTKEGNATANNLSARGTFMCGSFTGQSLNTGIYLNTSGQMSGYRNGQSIAAVDFNGHLRERVGSGYVDYYGLRLDSADIIDVTTRNFAMRVNESDTGYMGMTATFSQNIVTRIDASTGQFFFGTMKLQFINGILVSYTNVA